MWRHFALLSTLSELSLLAQAPLTSGADDAGMTGTHETVPSLLLIRLRLPADQVERLAEAA